MIVKLDDQPFVTVISGAALRQARRDSGRTQVDLAASVEVTQQYISALETGVDTDCSRNVAERISECLGVSLGRLFAAREALRMPRVTTDTRDGRNAA